MTSELPDIGLNQVKSRAASNSKQRDRQGER